MYDARAIANFFLDRADERGLKLVSIMTLLKVLFFAHAWYLAKENKPLIAQQLRPGNMVRLVGSSTINLRISGRLRSLRRAVSFDRDSCLPPTPYSLYDDNKEIFQQYF